MKNRIKLENPTQPINIQEVRLKFGEKLPKDLRRRVRVLSPDFPERDDVYVQEIILVPKGESIKIKFLENNTPYAQGISIGPPTSKEKIEILGNLYRGIMFFDTMAKGRDLIIKNLGRSNILEFHLAYINPNENNGCPRTSCYGSGMLIEELDDGKRIYRCNDVGVENVKFDKFVFSIEHLGLLPDPKT